MQLLAKSVDILPWDLRKRVRTIPIVAHAQRWLVSRFMSGQTFVHRISAGPAKGILLRLRLPEDKLYWTGTWEHDVTTALASLVRPGMICFDIGSHRGFMAGVMAANGAGRAVCFEPNPENARTIRDMASLNPAMRIEVLPYAVGAENGRGSFEVMPESSMGKLSASTFQREVTGTSRIDVEIRTIDGLVESEEVPPPGLVKIDIEGAEMDALRGAERVIVKSRPIMLIEVHSYQLLVQCGEWLRERRYRVKALQRPIEEMTAENFAVCHLLARPQ